MQTISSVVTVSVLSILFIFTHGSSVLENTSGVNITEGNCTNATVGDRVFFDHVERVGVPFVVRSQSDLYYGDPEIYCITVSNQLSSGLVNITDGGVGHRYATIEAQSGRGEGLNFNVSIYAK